MCDLKKEGLKMVLPFIGSSCLIAPSEIGILM